jgi:hypothetical protein
MREESKKKEHYTRDIGTLKVISASYIFPFLSLHAGVGAILHAMREYIFKLWIASDRRKKERAPSALVWAHNCMTDAIT